MKRFNYISERFYFKEIRPKTEIKFCLSNKIPLPSWERDL